MADCYIEIAENTFEIELHNSVTARIIYEHLPLNGSVSKYQEAIFFDIALPPIKFERTNDYNIGLGDIALWVEGSCICLFFGSADNDSDKYIKKGKLNVFGKVLGDLTILRSIKEGELINISK
ncbi:MAG: hypothetical protein ACD_21C00036G0001 [uncultured bacterium]|nr:MAG: hypothetical protein ACD_21C00036G0001 [uncultured bacterium]